MSKNIEKNGKFRWRRNIVRVLIMISFIGIGYFVGINKERNVISNENVEIEYIKVNDEIYDIYVTPKNNTNLTPEFNLSNENNYKDAWLTGRSKENAKKNYERIERDFPFTWNQ